jgi:CxxC motif-containing protein (DUF1111 family)
MKWATWAWSVGVGLLVLAPVGLRVLSWSGPRRVPVDAAEARAGQDLFEHEWTVNDPLAPQGDGLGPVFNATSCVACHHQGAVGGSGGVEHNVTTFTIRPNRADEKPREGVIHAHAVPGAAETMDQVHSGLPHESQPELAELAPLAGRPGRALHFPDGIHFSQRNTPALFGVRLIDEIPDRVIIAGERAQQLKWGLAPAKGEQLPVGRAVRLADGRVGRFGWKGQTASLAEFVRAACANELGLGNPGQAQPRPLGWPDYQPPGLDLTDRQCDQLTAFCASLPRAEERLPDDPAARDRAVAGKKLFTAIGCADCHTPDLGSVKGLYSDLLLHRMGQPLEGGGSYNQPPIEVPDFPSGDGPQPGEWRTPPLWGVADSAPYLHDGRAASLDEAIQLHGGQAMRAVARFRALNPAEQAEVIAFLRTLRAPEVRPAPGPREGLTQTAP